MCTCMCAEKPLTSPLDSSWKCPHHFLANEYISVTPRPAGSAVVHLSARSGCWNAGQHHVESAGSCAAQQLQGSQGHDDTVGKPADQSAALHQQSLGITAPFFERAPQILLLSSCMQQAGKSFGCWLHSHH